MIAPRPLTRYERQILDLLAGSTRPLGAYAIARRLSTTRKEVFAGTVYRCLDRLVSTGLAVRTLLGRGYAAAPPRLPAQGGKFVLFCTKCGKAEVVMAPASSEPQLIQLASSLRFNVRRIYLECGGICVNCRHA